MARTSSSPTSRWCQRDVEGLGDKIDAFYYAFGDDDVVAIVDLPSYAAATAVSLAVAATGSVRIKTTPLINVADEAAKLSVRYRAPGA
jgi:uncharacterized protein with GYD domain